MDDALTILAVLVVAGVAALFAGLRARAVARHS
jgi:hypothetical protein